MYVKEKEKKGGILVSIAPSQLGLWATLIRCGIVVHLSVRLFCSMVYIFLWVFTKSAVRGQIIGGLTCDCFRGTENSGAYTIVKPGKDKTLFSCGVVV